MLDARTGRTKVRMVDIHSTRYGIARRYMIRLRRDDFEDPLELAKFAAIVGMSSDDFRREFEYLIEQEPPHLVVDPERGLVEASEERQT
jgi:ATP-dependent phosphofructokinase / diphosphate-dependent phosphofructokinase